MGYGLIYKIKNNINGKVYIGQTTRNFEERYCGDVSKYTHNEHLKRSIEKYGIENFEINKEFALANSQEELDSLEKRFILEFKAYDYKTGYNKDFGGNGGVPTAETKAKMKSSQAKYKTPIVQLDAEFNLLNSFAGAVDVIGFDKSAVTTATKTKATVKGFYFLAEEEYLNATSTENGLLKLRCELAGKKYNQIVMVDEKLNIIKDTLDLKIAGASCTELKKRAKAEDVEFGQSFFYTTLDRVLSGDAKANYGKTFYAVDENKNIVAEYSRVTDVINDGLEKARVSACLSGKRNIYNGYTWVYKNDFVKGL